MGAKQTKRLSLFRRPWGAKKIIEVGGGHAPHEGITHAVDKFPDSNEHRAHALHVPEGVTFRQGDLENIPFDEKFDFLYASHVFEHVTNPARAVEEINRISSAGYIETPSPIWEQLQSTKQFDPNDIHKLFVWLSADGQLGAIPKVSETLHTFCNCSRGRFAARLLAVQKQVGKPLEPYITSRGRTTKVFFKAPLKFKLYPTFTAACEAGHCAYGNLEVVQAKLSLWPLNVVSRRLRTLRGFLARAKV